MFGKEVKVAAKPASTVLKAWPCKQSIAFRSLLSIVLYFSKKPKVLGSLLATEFCALQKAL